jgi:hypothetical protein
MSSRKWMNTVAEWKRPSRYIVVLIMVITAFVIYRYQDAIAIKKELQLEQEFLLVNAPMESTVLESKTHHKAGSAYIQYLYSAPYTFDDVVRHYSSELPKNGWSYHHRVALPSGTERVEFCKGQFAADIYR